MGRLRGLDIPYAATQRDTPCTANFAACTVVIGCSKNALGVQNCPEKSSAPARSTELFEAKVFSEVVSLLTDRARRPGRKGHQTATGSASDGASVRFTGMFTIFGSNLKITMSKRVHGSAGASHSQ